MRVHVAGAGAAGTSVALALHRAGWPLGEIACRSLDRARTRCELLGAGTAVALEDMLRSPGALAPEDGPHVLLVGAPDRHLEQMASRLASCPWPPGSVALHLSGSEPVEALQPLAERGVAIGSMHPLKSFVEPERDASLDGVVLALEGSNDALAQAERMASDVSARPFRLAPGGRAAWHAGAAHACNHLVALLDQSLDLLEVAGLDRDTARSALLPLLAGTVDNLRNDPPGRALTGPVVRGDAQVVARHLEAIQRLAPDIGIAYRSLASRALSLAREHRALDPELALKIETTLRDPPS